MKPGELVSKAERRKQGKALREKCSRSSHAEWKPRPSSQDPIKLLEASNAGRIVGLIPVRYERMSESPFTFYRGTAVIQARDLTHSPASGVIVQACGDCHLMNFGGFATPERTLVFDMNDFDETFPAPWEWDVKRLGPSLVLAARDRGFSKQVAKDAVRAATQAYRERMSKFAEDTELGRWYEQVKSQEVIEYFRKDRDFLGRLKKKRKAAQSSTSEAAFPKLTAVVNGRRKIKDNPPFIYHFQEQFRDFKKRQQEFWQGYLNSLQGDRRQLFARYLWQDGAIKVVGVGSVGTRCFVALFLADEDDPLFLQTKEARRSVLEPPQRKSRFKHQGLRVVEGQRLMQAASDIFLGWANSGGHDYYVRQFRDMKVSAEPETFKPGTLLSYATMCGWALARAHAKAGDASMIAGYLGSNDSFDEALVKYSLAYADQAESDFEAFRNAIRSGRLSTKPPKSSGLEYLF
jgi:uncharacterized protein (DUF2252 family)